jgi:hypothetical protein
LEEIVAAPVKKPENTAVGIRHADNTTSAKVVTNFADKRRSLGLYSSFLLDLHQKLYFWLLLNAYFPCNIEKLLTRLIICWIVFSGENCSEFP